MIAKVETRDVKPGGQDLPWEVTVSVWEGDRCVCSADLYDGRHDKRWHQTYAEELARHINEGQQP